MEVTGCQLIFCIGSLSSGTLHLLKWKDKKGGKHIFRLVDRVSAKWKDFGLLLGLSPNQLSAWERQFRGNANKCWTKVMEHWLNGGAKDDYPPTWEGLYMLLENAQFLQVAEDLKKAVQEATAVKESSDDSAGELVTALTARAKLLIQTK